MTVSDMEFMCDELTKSFNLSYDAVGSLLQKQAPYLSEIEKFLSAMKKTMGLLEVMQNMCLDPELKEMISENYYRKKNDLDVLEQECQKQAIQMASPEENQTHYL